MTEKMKKVRLPVTIGVADEAASTAELRHESGFLIEPARTVVRYVSPGTPVELPEREANRLLALHGPYTETVVVTEGDVTPPVAAPVAAPVSSVRR